MMLAKLVRQQCDSIFRITPYFTKLTHSYPKRAMGDDFVLLFSFVLPQYVKLCGKNLELQKAKGKIYLCDLDSGYLLKWKGYLKRLG